MHAIPNFQSRFDNLISLSGLTIGANLIMRGDIEFSERVDSPSILFFIAASHDDNFGMVTTLDEKFCMIHSMICMLNGT